MAKAITWGECLDYTLRNLETWRNGGGRESAILYSGYFTRYQGRTFPAHRISKGLMTDICTSLEEEGKKNATINRFISAVSMVLKYCKENDVITFDLPTPFKRRKERDKTVRKLPVWRVDLNLNVINVEHTKNEEPRCIPIHPQLMNTLIARCEGNPKDKVFGVDWNNADQVRWQFKNLLHSLRHSFATWHLANGTPPIELMSMLGHKNLTTTLLYAKATAAGQRKAQDDLQF